MESGEGIERHHIGKFALSPSAQLSWNPVKELKESVSPAEGPTSGRLVESGEGIESLQPRNHAHEAAGLWNPVKELKGIVVLAESSVSGRVPWNPEKELKALPTPTLLDPRYPKWNPEKELKELYPRP